MTAGCRPPPAATGSTSPHRHRGAAPESAAFPCNTPATRPPRPRRRRSSAASGLSSSAQRGATPTVCHIVSGRRTSWSSPLTTLTSRAYTPPCPLAPPRRDGGQIPGPRGPRRHLHDGVLLRPRRPTRVTFLYDLHRLNVAISRAQCVAIVVASPTLLDAAVHDPEQLRAVNGLITVIDSALLPRPHQIHRSALGAIRVS